MKNHTLFFTEGNPGFENCDAAVLGVAFDGNASYGRGAAEAPEAIMRASHQMDIENPMTGKTLEIAIHNFGIIEPKNAVEMADVIIKERDLSGRAAEAYKLMGKALDMLGNESLEGKSLNRELPQDVSGMAAVALAGRLEEN